MMGTVRNRIAVQAAVLCTGLVLTAGTLLFARQQSGEQAPPVFRADTDVVRLEVGVLDRDRRPVSDLTAADFIVLEDGHERPVVAFTSVSLPTPESIAGTPTASWVRDAPLDVVSNAGADQGRLVTMAIDWSVRGMDLELARRIALAAVEGLGPGDEAAILFSSPFSNAGVPQNFTADRSQLRARINQAVATALVDKDGVIVDPEGYESGGCLCGMCTLEALTRVATSLRDVSQRPEVVLFIGTYARTYEMMAPPRALPRDAGPAAQAFNSTNPNVNTCPARLLHTRRTFERAAGEANITVHSLDPAGLVSGDGPLGGRERERLDSLAVVPDMTGGRTVQRTNAPEALVPAILEESGSYYVLGFTPASTTRDGRSNRIQVRVRRPNVTVKARDRYTREEAPVSALASDDAGLIRTLGGALPSPDVPLEVSLVPMLTAGSPGAAVFVVGRLSGEAATAPESVSLLSAAFNPRGRSVASKRVMLRPPGTGGANHSAMGTISGLPLEPGHYEVRVAVERPGGTGSVHAFVEVPDFARLPLALSGVLMHVAPEEATAPREEIDGNLPFVPTARRTFASTDTVSAFLQVSQGVTRSNPLHAVNLRARVLDSSGRTVRDQSMAIAPEHFNRGRSTNARFSVPVDALAPGRYLLTVDARAGADSATRTVRFEVR